MRAPSRAGVQRALQRAATDPCTWGPLVGAAVIGAGGWDRQISDWARDAAPLDRVLGEREAVSHIAVYIGLAATAYTAWAPVAAPLPYEDPRSQRLRMAGTAVGAQLGATLLLKQAIGRTRPKHGKDDSMPSGHASTMGVTSAITSRQVERLGLPRAQTTALQAGGAALVVLNGWSRLELGRHFATDILVGQALGNAIGVFTYELLSPDARARPFVRIDPRRDETTVELGLTQDL